jgi:pseudouridine-5'-phosphate glycosidase
LTQGDSVSANRSLIEGNVLRGTKVAIELAALESQNTVV